mmetsp:Transcript_20596/g.64356  ORF Transcript_20596/g.64356 Transcript_20596/m.64356 type:complete len:223 (+) Transcript_20596:802-1470(+)
MSSITLETCEKHDMKRSTRCACTAEKRCETVRAADRDVSHSPSTACSRSCTSSNCSIAFMFGAIPSTSPVTRSSSAAAPVSSSWAASPASEEKSTRSASSCSSPAGSACAPPSIVPVPTRPVGENDSLTSKSALEGPAAAAAGGSVRESVGCGPSGSRRSRKWTPPHASATMRWSGCAWCARTATPSECRAMVRERLAAPSPSARRLHWREAPVRASISRAR